MSIPNRSPHVGDAGTRVMLTLLRLHARQPSVTLAELADAVGRNKTTIHRHLTVLRDHGLVEWEDDQAGTLRPTARLLSLGDVA